MIYLELHVENKTKKIAVKEDYRPNFIYSTQVQKLDAPSTLDIDLSIWIRKHVSISLHTISAP